MRPAYMLLFALSTAACGKSTSTDTAPIGSTGPIVAPASSQGQNAGPELAAVAQIPQTALTRIDPPADMIDADLLLNEYRENEIRADASYKGKFILIRGKVGEVRRSPEGAYVTLAVDGSPPPNVVQCFVGPAGEGELASLSRGDRAHVAGRVEGLQTTLRVRSCSLNPDMKACRLLTNLLGRGECEAQTDPRGTLVALKVDGAEALLACATAASYRRRLAAKWPPNARIPASESSLCAAPIIGAKDTAPPEELVKKLQEGLDRIIWTEAGPMLAP